MGVSPKWVKSKRRKRKRKNDRKISFFSLKNKIYISSSYAKILGEKLFRTWEFPRSERSERERERESARGVKNGRGRIIADSRKLEQYNCHVGVLETRGSRMVLEIFESVDLTVSESYSHVKNSRYIFLKSASSY